jgi:hypothetical protein
MLAQIVRHLLVNNVISIFSRALLQTPSVVRDKNDRADARHFRVNHYNLVARDFKAEPPLRHLPLISPV